VPVETRDSSAHGYFTLGLAYTAQENQLDAALAYRQAVRLAPDSADYHNNLAWSRAKLGFFESAAAGFQHALRLRPGNALARNNLAWVQGELAARSAIRRE
jgi:Flp pilus assembly protein TadD